MACQRQCENLPCGEAIWTKPNDNNQLLDSNTNITRRWGDFHENDPRGGRGVDEAICQR